MVVKTIGSPCGCATVTCSVGSEVHAATQATTTIRIDAIVSLGIVGLSLSGELRSAHADLYRSRDAGNARTHGTPRVLRSSPGPEWQHRGARGAARDRRRTYVVRSRALRR